MSSKRARSCLPVSMSEFTILADNEMDFLINDSINEADLDLLFKDCENTGSESNLLTEDDLIEEPLVPENKEKSNGRLIEEKVSEPGTSVPLLPPKKWTRAGEFKRSYRLAFFKENCEECPRPWENPWTPKTKGNPIHLSFNKKRISLPPWWIDLCYDQWIALKSELLHEILSQGLDGVFNVSGHFCRILNDELILVSNFYLYELLLLFINIFIL